MNHFFSSPQRKPRSSDVNATGFGLTTAGMTASFCLLLSAVLLATPPKLPTFPPLKFDPPKPERVVLPNGLVLYLLEDHELPLIQVSALIRAGSQYDPVDRVGLSGILGPVMT